MIAIFLTDGIYSIGNMYVGVICIVKTIYKFK